MQFPCKSIVSNVSMFGSMGEELYNITLQSRVMLSCFLLQYSSKNCIGWAHYLNIHTAILASQLTYLWFYYKDLWYIIYEQRLCFHYRDNLSAFDLSIPNMFLQDANWHSEWFKIYFHHFFPKDFLAMMILYIVNDIDTVSSARSLHKFFEGARYMYIYMPCCQQMSQVWWWKVNDKKHVQASLNLGNFIFLFYSSWIFSAEIQNTMVEEWNTGPCLTQSEEVTTTIYYMLA